MKRVLFVFAVFFLFNCKQKEKGIQVEDSHFQNCPIEEKIEKCLVKIMGEPERIYPIFSHMDSLSLNRIQFNSNIPTNFSSIVVRGTDFKLSDIEPGDKSKRLIFDLDKISCSLAEFHIAVMENDYGRSLYGEVFIDGDGIKVKIRGEADIN